MKAEYRRYDSAYTSPVFGVNNNGAICWWNSVLQVVLGIPSLAQVVLEKRDELAHGKLSAEYIRLLDGLVPTSPELEPIEPALFAGASTRLLAAMLQEGGNTALGYGQQCAAEGFSTFLETLKSPDVDVVFCNAYKQIIKCKQCQKQVSTFRDTANRINIPPTKNFATDAEQRAWMTYTAGLPIHHKHRHVIKNFTTAEEFQKWLMNHAALTYDFKCPECHHNMPIVARGEVLTMLREVLVISFDMINRVDPTWFPQEMSFPSLDGSVLKYVICGKICWSGSVRTLQDGRIASGGHYWAHSLREGNWYCLNDSSTSAGNSYPDNSTFMVVYHLAAE